jgi:prolyl oligopeptidase
MLERKQNVFDDFYAAAEWLIAERYTSPGRLGVRGGSNGGLLTGVTITQRPALAAAAIVAVPLLDMLRYEQFLMARYWVPEYGSAEDARQFGYLRAYSPYHNIVPGTAYPAVLLTAAENDSRVHALHARKFAAALQAATASDPDDKPVLLRVDRDVGHGPGKPLVLRIRDAADELTFMAHELGLEIR